MLHLVWRIYADVIGPRLCGAHVVDHHLSPARTECSSEADACGRVITNIAPFRPHLRPRADTEDSRCVPRVVDDVVILRFSAIPL